MSEACPIKPFSDVEFILVNGILTNPRDIKGWTDRAERWYENQSITAVRYEYFSGALTRFIFQESRVNDLLEIMKDLEKPFIYVGHSNGCELLSRMLKKHHVRFEAAHLFAAAVDPDFNENGFNKALEDNKLGKLFCYCSKNDKILQNGKKYTGFLNPIGLGYGNLGQVGPSNLSTIANERTYVHWNDDLNHSDWWSPSFFEKSLKMTLRR